MAPEDVDEDIGLVSGDSGEQGALAFGGRELKLDYAGMSERADLGGDHQVVRLEVGPGASAHRVGADNSSVSA